MSVFQHLFKQTLQCWNELQTIGVLFLRDFFHLLTTLSQSFFCFPSFPSSLNKIEKLDPEEDD